MPSVRIDEGPRCWLRWRRGGGRIQECGGGFEDELGLLFLSGCEVGAREVFEAQRRHLGPAVGGLQLGDVDVQVEAGRRDREGLGHECKGGAHRAGLGVALRALGQELDGVIHAPFTHRAVGQAQVSPELLGIDVEDSAVHALGFCETSCAEMGTSPGQRFLRASNHHG